MIRQRICIGSKRLYSSVANQQYAATTYARPPIVFTKGQGSRLWDSTGKEYIDFSAGIAVNGLGHCDAGVAEILADQSKKLVHASNLFFNEWTLQLSKNLVETTKAQGGMKDASKVFMCNSGTEANEAALKFARKIGRLQSDDKIELVSFAGCFHGRTMGALSVTANPKYQAPFAPLVPGVKVGQINDIASIESLVTDKTCGVIVEPIQGEGGINVSSAEFLVALKKRCQEVGAVLIYDEIQCGLGRTGKLWAHQWLPQEAHPDIVTMAKALGNGFPIGATMISDKVNDALKVGDHGTTYGGNPLGCRVGDYVLSKLSSPELLAGVEERHNVFVDRLNRIKEKNPSIVTEIRGKGLLLGLQLTTDPSPIVKKSLDNGLVVITCGTNTLRFIPALNIPLKDIEEGFDKLESSF
ncbi:acetylornithine aminotransferase, mitochondrial [Trichomonascus vanleenenianus]|uniref:aspartate aminotransferase family protein n=1 Tax=Trichomonascus vanleenenianus TaxID=2268995 RepID=UPI003EC99AEF